MPNFKVHEHKVLLSMYQSGQSEEVLASGLIMPSQSSNEPDRGEVVAAGAESGYSVGQDVLVAVQAGITFSYSGTEYVLMHKDQILAALL